MISVHSMKRPMIGGQPYAFEFKGLSTDTKPSVWGGNDVGVNSLFFEQDTGDFYYLKQQGSESVETVTDLEETQLDSTNGSSEGEIDIYIIANTNPPTKDTVYVTFDGTEYECTKFEEDGYEYYGAPLVGGQVDFSTYPFRFFYTYNDLNFTFSIHIVIEDMGHGVGTHLMSIVERNIIIVPTAWEKIGGSGGSGMELRPKLNITVVNPTEKDISIYGNIWEYVDGSVVDFRLHLIRAGETKTIEGYVVGAYSYDNWFTGEGATIMYSVSSFNGEDEDGIYYVGNGSDPVNIDNDWNVIDPTKPASYTATLEVD